MPSGAGSHSNVIGKLIPPAHHLHQHLVAEGHAFRIRQTPAALLMNQPAALTGASPARSEQRQVAITDSACPTAGLGLLPEVDTFTATQADQEPVVEGK